MKGEVGAPGADIVRRQWAEVERFVSSPEAEKKIAEPTARRLLELHHQLDGFELPSNVERSLAKRLGMDPGAAKERFQKEESRAPADTMSFRELGRLLVDDISKIFSNMKLSSPIEAMKDIFQETKEVFERSRMPHLSKSEKKTLRAQFDRLHTHLREEMKTVQGEVSKLEQARAKLLSGPTGAPVKPEELDARGQLQLKKLDGAIEENKSVLHQLGNVGMTFTALRGESFWEQNNFVVQGGADLTAFMPMASAGIGGVREIAVRDARTGQAETKDSVSLIGLLTNGFGRKVVSVEDIKNRDWKKILGTKGLGGGFSPLPFVNVVRDPVVGDVIGVFVPGLGFGQINARPDGQAGFGGGLVFGLPGLPLGPTAVGNWNHPVFHPVVSRVIAPLSRFFGYAIRAVELGVIEPAKKGIARISQKKSEAETPPPKESPTQ